MNGAIAVGCVWLIAANVTAMFPSKDHHWRNAYMLIAVGLPLVVWIALAAGWLMAAVFLGAGASVLRWPVIYLGRRLRRIIRLERGG